MALSDGDDKLVKRAKKGDSRAFDLLVLKYQGRVAQLVSRYVSNAAEVEDVTQEAFIKAYRALPKFRGDSAFYTWLYRIAANAAKNHLVALSRRPTTDLALDDSESYEVPGRLKDNESPDEVIMGQQLEAVISQAIDALPLELKAALTLREFEGLSYDEIAEVLECPIGTVRSRIFRAREAIDQKVASQMQGELG
ncbi:MAG: RNA polymerase sigma factor RpoE [Halieaceae bacterium]|nr:RNA polymerase sigma factor RpoE [Halieaceae bacterium]MDG1655485.1 RNA polymerase sigma factor RpoE [Luminiphilus sp.]MBT5135042.1 RNA polymerase sigma factor RpoE [Halieaceae bacterium]MBT5557183.1 RNA polymerase sigma factor RpoE [Halieaceae bacterium]MBT6182171.1 RNA polymerase sigma factor RpoE [Halieaceae bacterium]